MTERTFFRNLADKREVLFDGEAKLRAALTAALHATPDGLAPLETLFRAFLLVQSLLEDNRPFAEPRQKIISATPALAERELAKLAALTDVLAGTLRSRGVSEVPAVLVEQVGMAAFADATFGWLKDPESGLGERLYEAFRALKALLAPPSGRSRGGRRPKD